MTLEIHVYGRPVTLTDATIRETFRWYADIERKCSAAAQAGEFRVNDLPRYVADCEASAKKYDAQAESGAEERLSLAFIQQAYFIQSGESVPILPGGAA